MHKRRSSLSRFFRMLFTLVCVAALCLPHAALAAAPAAAESDSVWMVFSDPLAQSSGIELIESDRGDSLYTLTTASNRPVMAVEKYAYFRITDEALLAASEVTVTVTLLNTEATAVLFQYCGETDNYQGRWIRTTGSGGFITVEVALYDAALHNAAQNLGAAFRLQGGTVHEIRLRTGAAKSLTVDFTDPVRIRGGADLIASDSENGDSEYTLTTAQGRDVVTISKYAYFTVTNEYLLDIETATLTVTFLDEGNSHITFQYCSGLSAYESIYIQRYNTGEFVTVEIPLDDLSLRDAAQNYHASFRFYQGTIETFTLTPGYEDHTDQAPPEFAPQTALNNIIGKGIAGYQVWFRASETAEGNWHHWSESGGYPAAGNVHPEIYPYTDDYVENGATLYPNELGDLGNGSPSLLFNSPDREIIRTHMEWMQEYDIDGAAVQRFYSATNPMRISRTNTLQVIQQEAEATGRIFYVMYDFSYASRHDPETFIRTVKRDFVYNAEETGVVSSPNYGHADGKPVVCLWGLHGDPASEYFCGETATILIEWFQERGYYVIGGSPDNNYDKAEGEYLEPFTKLDMLSLWTVGRYTAANMQRWYDVHIPIDLAFCEQYDIDYQPVIWSGFGWSNMKNNGPPNSHPRYAGEFLWDQAYILKNEYDVNTVYFAMWDEYDEGTAIMKAATDYFEIPTDQYFLTYATDGWWLSNDFYLRVSEAIMAMLQGDAPVQEELSVPHSLGPIYWRNSFESRETTYTYDGGITTIPTVQQLDVCLNNPTWLARANVTGTTAEITSPIAKSGESAFRFSGTALQGHEAVYKIADTAITASQTLEFSYYINAANENGKGVYADLLFSDGTRLSDTNAAVIQLRGGISQWECVKIPLGPSAEGKTVVGVIVGYAGGSGYFEAYLDDFLLQHSEDAHTWDNGVVTEEATATARGVLTYTCENDGCNTAVTEWYTHDPATCDHSHSEERDRIAPTCTESGFAAGVWCIPCNNYVEDGEVLPAHKTELHNAVPPAVGIPGREAGVWCTVCERYIEGGAEIPALVSLLGDVDNNNKVDSTDARLTLQYAVKKIDATVLDLTVADVDGSQEIDSTDARLILQYAVGKIKAFPVE